MAVLTPRKTKYRKQFKGNAKGISGRGVSVAFGDYGLKSVGRGFISSAQIEAARKSITFFTKRGGRIWIRIFPHKPITKKPPETKMGSGKGEVAGYVAVVKPGAVMFEMAGVSKDIAFEALKRAGQKLPLLTKIVEKE